MKFLVPVTAAFALATLAPVFAQDAAAPASAPMTAPPAGTTAPTMPPASMDATAPATPSAPPTSTDATAPSTPPAPMDATASAPMPTPVDSASLPVCSRSVTDKCRQSASEQRMAGDNYKGGGRDNSAMMGQGGTRHGGMTHRRRHKTM